MSKVRAIIPAAGQGKRMRPLTHTRPKVLLPVAGRPMLGHLISDLADIGIQDFTLVIGYYGEKVKEYCLQNFPELTFRFVVQRKRLGLGHAVGEAVDPADGPILIALGDTLFRGDLGELLGETASLGLAEVDDARRFGVAVVEGDRIVHLEEKPEKPKSNYIIAGVYYLPDAHQLKSAIDETIRRDLRTRGEYQITDALQVMIKQGIPFRPVHLDGWYDCGVPDSLIEVNKILFSERPEVRHVPAAAAAGNIIIGPVFIDESAVVCNSILGPNVHIGADCLVERCILADSIVDDGSRLSGMHLTGAVLGQKIQLQRTGEKLMVGDHGRLFGA